MEGKEEIVCSDWRLSYLDFEKLLEELPNDLKKEAQGGFNCVLVIRDEGNKVDSI